MGNVSSKLMWENKVNKESCQHVGDREHYEEQLRELTLDKAAIKEKLLRPNEVIQELGKFHIEYGNSYPENTVTALADECNKETWSELNDEESKLYNLDTKMKSYRFKLQLIEEDAEKTKCQCLNHDQLEKINRKQ